MQSLDCISRFRLRGRDLSSRPPAYDPADDNEPHIALNNIRQRLDMMCNGTLEITLHEEGGTTVKVTIPDQSGESFRK